MRISETEKTWFSRFRDVSDLRIQFLCEYRLYLRQHIDEERTKASVEGERLHSKFTNEYQDRIPKKSIIPLIIIIITIVVGLLWILW